jgi:hypothetical protein
MKLILLPVSLLASINCFASQFPTGAFNCTQTISSGLTHTLEIEISSVGVGSKNIPYLRAKEFTSRPSHLTRSNSTEGLALIKRLDLDGSRTNKLTLGNFSVSFDDDGKVRSLTGDASGSCLHVEQKN